ncbi:MAG: hypothetical protein GYB67_11355 [Chloroflexi bacterium]|nr:hypothetical protein [Chloroflexota bacterium]
MLNARFQRWGLLLLAGLIMATPAWAQPGAQPDCDPNLDYVFLAEASFAEFDYPAAVAFYTCALEFDPDNYDLNALRLDAQVLAENYVNAFSDAVVLRDFAPSEITDATFDRYDALIAEDPDDIRGYALRAFLNWYLANDDLAFPDYAEMLRIDPESVLAYLLRGSSYAYTGFPEDAEADFATTLELDATNPEIYWFIGITYGDNADYVSADRLMSEGIALNPPDVFEYYADRAFYRREYGNIMGAIEDLTQAVGIAQDSADLFLDLGMAYELKGRPDIAAGSFYRYTQLIETDPITFFEPFTSGDDMTITLEEGRVFYFEIEMRAQQTLDITATSVDGFADPLVVVLGPDGQTPLVGNDNREPDSTNSLIIEPMPYEGTYTVIVTHGSGGAFGDVAVFINVGFG